MTTSTYALPSLFLPFFSFFRLPCFPPRVHVRHACLQLYRVETGINGSLVSTRVRFMRTGQIGDHRYRRTMLLELLLVKREEKEREEKTNLKTARYFPVYLPLNNSSTDDRATFKKKKEENSGTKGDKVSRNERDNMSIRVLRFVATTALSFPTIYLRAIIGQRIVNVLCSDI